MTVRPCAHRRKWRHRADASFQLIHPFLTFASISCTAQYSMSEQAVLAASSRLSELAHRHARPILGQCPWPIKIVSQKRELDLTECFENGVLLPIPLLLMLVLACGQLFSARGRLKRGESKWIDRGKAGESIYRYKSVCPLQV